MTANPNWTVDEALEADKKALAENPARLSDPTMPFFQWLAYKMLEACKAGFENGNQIELMRAIQICATHELVLPEWASKAYISAYMKVVRAREKSWDRVFGAPYQKGFHLNALQKKLKLQHAVWLDIKDAIARDPSTPIDVGLFEKVGKKHNLGKTLASEYYYDVERGMGRK